MNRTLRVGLFTAAGVSMIVGFSVYVNDKPYWYRSCNEVNIHVDDATGLRRKSPVRTLGLDVGYINKVDLDGERVLVQVCVTGPVRLNPETRAYIRTSGFLGDKFLELKPMDRVDDSRRGATGGQSAPVPPAPKTDSGEREPTSVPMGSLGFGPSFLKLALTSFLAPFAHAETTTLNASREAELQDTVKKVGKLIDQLTLMVGDLREVTQQREFKDTIINLNNAMKHLELMLRPQGKTMRNVDAAMESLKNTMADAETVMKKVKEGEGTIGKFINDPSIYDEIKTTIRGINLLLGKAGGLRTFVDLSAHNIKAYDGTKAKFSVIIAPNPGRYYLVGITTDPRGRDRRTTTTTQINNGTPSVEVKDVNEEKGLRITAMFGKYFGPFDLRVGILEDNGAVGAGYWLDEGRRYGVHIDVFSTGRRDPYTVRAYARAQVFSSVYLIAGIDSNRKYKGDIPVFFGAGLFFDDDDLKYLLAFR
jgi:phospholipid/cholesterol/gamma-HCH transport system substrate-binding protein